MNRLDPFYDPEDLTVCVPAGESVAELNARLAKDGLYFPLWRDPRQTLGELYLRHRVCSRSFRFGLVGDNVLGCRFRLRNGKTVDLGGRVVKNVTGFDLVRFLAGSQGRFGSPETLVLRLRPLPDIRKAITIEGNFQDLESFRAAFLQSPWAHAVDAFDFEVNAQGLRLVLAWSCSKEEAPYFEAAIQAPGCLVTESELPQHRPGRELYVPLSQTLATARLHSNASGFLGQGLLILPDEPEPPSPPDPLEIRFLELLERLP